MRIQYLSDVHVEFHAADVGLSFRLFARPEECRRVGHRRRLRGWRGDWACARPDLRALRRCPGRLRAWQPRVIRNDARTRARRHPRSVRAPFESPLARWRCRGDRWCAVRRHAATVSRARRCEAPRTRNERLRADSGLRALGVSRERSVRWSFCSARLRAGDIVVTHYLPVEASVAPRWKGGALNPFFLCDVEQLIRERAPTALDLTVTRYDSINVIVGATRVVANPFGYARVELNHSFEDRAIIGSIWAVGRPRCSGSMELPEIPIEAAGVTLHGASGWRRGRDVGLRRDIGRRAAAARSDDDDDRDADRDDEPDDEAGGLREAAAAVRAPSARIGFAVEALEHEVQELAAASSSFSGVGETPRAGCTSARAVTCGR